MKRSVKAVMITVLRHVTVAKDASINTSTSIKGKHLMQVLHILKIKSGKKISTNLKRFGIISQDFRGLQYLSSKRGLVKISAI